MYLARNWEAAIINIGHADTRGGFFTRVLHLIQNPGGERLAPYAPPPQFLRRRPDKKLPPSDHHEQELSMYEMLAVKQSIRRVDT
jgi:hypothetical protein